MRGETSLEAGTSVLASGSSGALAEADAAVGPGVEVGIAAGVAVAAGRISPVGVVVGRRARTSRAVLFEAGTLVIVGDTSVGPVEAGTAVGLGGRVGIAVRVVVAGAGGWVDAPWQAEESNRAAVAISPNAKLRGPMNRC